MGDPSWNYSGLVLSDWEDFPNFALLLTINKIDRTHGAVNKI